MQPRSQSTAILGGAVSGLAVAHRLSRLDRFDDITVFERQDYNDRRVNCGEAINEAPLIPLDHTPGNGFVNDVEGFELRIFSGMDRSPDEAPLSIARFPCAAGYICERDVVERRWAESLGGCGVQFETGTAVSREAYRAIVSEYDYVVDATGEPALTLKANNAVDNYTGRMIALNATVEGDFSTYRRWPRIFFEGYLGYSWSFPKSDRHANVGIGWAGEQRPEHYVTALQEAARRNGFTVPDRSDINIYTIPRGPSLAPQYVSSPADRVFLVGDAAGIANRYQGEGICQGVRSAYLLGDLIETNQEAAYPERLYELMKPEYRLASIMRSAWVEHEDPELIAAIADAIDGLSIEAITRSPSRVLGRLMRHPAVAFRLFADPGVLRHVLRAYTDRWEYESGAGNRSTDKQGECLEA